MAKNNKKKKKKNSITDGRKVELALKSLNNSELKNKLKTIQRELDDSINVEYILSNSIMV